MQKNIYIYNENLELIAQPFVTSFDEFLKSPELFYPNWAVNMYVTETKVENPILDGDSIREKTRLERILDGEENLLEDGEYLENNQIIKIEYDPKLDFLKKIWDKDLHIWKEGATDEEITEHMATSVTKLLYEVLKLGCEVEINGKKHIQSLSDEKRKALNERKSGFDLAEELGAPITEVFWPFKDDGSDNVLMSAEDFKKMILKCFKYGEQCYIAAELLKAKRKITSTIEDFMTELNNVNSISLNNL